MEQPGTLPRAFVLLRGGEGMGGGRSRRTFPSAADGSVAAGGTAGRFALAGRRLEQAAFLTMTSAKIPAQGFFNPCPVRGGEREEAQLPSHCEVLQMLVAGALLPLASSSHQLSTMGPGAYTP